MTDSRRDFRSFFLVLVSTGANTVLGFLGGLVLIVGLDQAQYGLVSSAMAILLVAQELVGRGINDSLIRLGTDKIANSRARADEIFRAGLLLKVMIAVAIGLLSALFMASSRSYAWLIGDAEVAQALPAIFAAVGGYGLWSFVLTRYQARLAFRRLACVQPVNNALRFTLLVLFIALGALTWLRALWIYAGCLLLSATLFGLKDWTTLFRRAWKPETILPILAAIWRYSRWNLIAATAFVTYMRMDVFMLTRMAGKTDVAVYNASWQVLLCIDLCSISIMTVMIPEACHRVCRGELLRWMLRSMKLSAAGAVMSLPLFLFARWYVPACFGPEYTNSAELIRIIYFGSVLTLFVFPMIGILYAKERFLLIACIHVLVLLVSVPAYANSIEAAGVLGAAWTTLGIKVAASTLLAAAVGWCVLCSPNRLEDGTQENEDEVLIDG